MIKARTKSYEKNARAAIKGIRYCWIFFTMIVTIVTFRDDLYTQTESASCVFHLEIYIPCPRQCWCWCISDHWIWTSRKSDRVQLYKVLLANSLRFYSMLWSVAKEEILNGRISSRLNSIVTESDGWIAQARVCKFVKEKKWRFLKCLRFSNENWMSGELIKSTINLSYTWTRCEIIQVMTL